MGNIAKRKHHSSVIHCREIDEDVSIGNIECIQCQDCHSQHPDLKKALNLYNKNLQKIIEGWLFKKIHSFEEIAKWFYTKEQAIEFIVNYAKKHENCGACGKEDYLKSHLAIICFYFKVCNQEFFLKASIHQYCVNGYHAGLWPLKEGYHDEWVRIKNVKQSEENKSND